MRVDTAGVRFEALLVCCNEVEPTLPADELSSECDATLSGAVAEWRTRWDLDEGSIDKFAIFAEKAN